MPTRKWPAKAIAKGNVRPRRDLCEASDPDRAVKSLSSSRVIPLKKTLSSYDIPITTYGLMLETDALLAASAKQLYFMQSRSTRTTDAAT